MDIRKRSIGGSAGANPSYLFWTGAILIGAALFSAGCADADGDRPFGGTLVLLEDLEVLLHDDGVGTLIGGRMDAPALESFRRIVDVSFHPLGRFVAILDGDPPYLRVFDLEGTLLWTSLERGDGPGETRNPRWVSVNEAGILVYGDRRLTWLDAAGQFLGDRATPNLRVTDGSPGCGAGTCDVVWQRVRSSRGQLDLALGVRS